MRIGRCTWAVVCLGITTASVATAQGLPSGPVRSDYGRRVEGRGSAPSSKPAKPQPAEVAERLVGTVADPNSRFRNSVVARNDGSGWKLAVADYEKGRRTLTPYDPARHGTIEPPKRNSFRGSARGARGALEGDDPGKAADLSQPELIGPRLTQEDAGRLGLPTGPLDQAIDDYAANPTPENRRRVDHATGEVDKALKQLNDRIREAGGDHLLGVPFEELTRSDINEYAERLRNDPELKKRHDKAMEYARRAVDLLRKLQDAEADAESFFTWNKDYYRRKAKQLEKDIKALAEEYSEKVGDDLLTLGQSRFSDDMFQRTDGGRGLGGAVDAYLAKTHAWNDGLQPTYDEMLLVPGGLLTRGLGRAAMREGGKRLGAWSAARATAASVKDKLARYLLNPAHKIGGPKAKWFEKALGFTKNNMGKLAKQIKFDPKKAVQTAVTQHGTKFNQTIAIKGANGKTIDVTFAWIRNNDGIVRLVTAIPTKLK